MDQNLEVARKDLLSDSPERQAKGVQTVKYLADQGDGLAIYALATWHLHGSYGCEVDLGRAKQLLEAASKKLVKEAMFDLAALIEKTEVSKNKNRLAFGLYVVGGLLGDQDSIEEIRRCFHWGIGTFKNSSTADLVDEILISMKESSQRDPD